MLEASGRIAALWLNVGNAHTAEGQAEKLEWMLEHGARIGSYRGEAERRFGEFVAANAALDHCRRQSAPPRTPAPQACLGHQPPHGLKPRPSKEAPQPPLQEPQRWPSA
jgi:hypothetical protein